jgi:hypothetical protein
LARNFNAIMAFDNGLHREYPKDSLSARSDGDSNEYAALDRMRQVYNEFEDGKISNFESERAPL